MSTRIGYRAECRSAGRTPVLRGLPLLSAAVLQAALLAAACGGEKAVTGPTGPSTVASIRVTPALDTAVSIGETVTFSAVAKDAKGQPISGASLSWSSSATSVATVSGSGVATAKANGTARIIASVGGKADSARLVVKQKAVSLSLTPDSANLRRAGDTVTFAAVAVDAKGHPVAGSAPTWSVSNAGLASIDQSGLATAHATGRLLVRAALDGLADSAALRIGLLAAPVIQSVTPDPIPEGGEATVAGQHFEAIASGDTVSVDGERVTVTDATATSFRIAVPTYDCLPARTVQLRLATAGGAATSGTPLQPDEPTVSVAVGHQSILTDPSTFCLQFPAASSGSYLVGVQSLAPLQDSSLTSAELTAEAVGGGGAAAVARAGRSYRGRALVGRRPGRAPGRWTSGEAWAEAWIGAWMGQHVPPGSSIPALGASAQRISAAVAGDVSVGDTVHVKVPHVGVDICNEYTDVAAVVKAVGAHGIFVADTANPASGFTDSDYQDFSDLFESTIYDTDVSYFGDPGDIDGNGHIVIVFTRVINQVDPGFLGSPVEGFVAGTDLLPTSSSTGIACPASNEGEYYYQRVPDPTGIYGPPSTRTYELVKANVGMAHEPVHIIQNGRRMPLNLATGLGTALSESQAVLAEEVVGDAVTGRQPYQNYGYDVALNTGGTDAVPYYLEPVTRLFAYFGYDSTTATHVGGAPAECGWWRGDPSPCVGVPQWYAAGWSFERWISDQYGPSFPGGEQGLQKALVVDPGSGLDIVSDVVGVGLDTLLARWSAALYVDDRIPSPDPSLTFSSWNLHDFELHTPTAEHLQPTGEGFADWTAETRVRGSSTAYFLVSGATHPATALRVRAPGGAALPSYMQLWVVRLQ